jgi:hypothetical protein
MKYFVGLIGFSERKLRNNGSLTLELDICFNEKKKLLNDIDV